MTLDQLAGEMKQQWMSVKNNKNLTQEQKSGVAGQFRQLLGAARSGNLTPQQMAGEWQKAQNLLKNNGNVSISTNGNVGRQTRGYSNAFDAKGRRIRGSTLQVNGAPGAPSSDEYGNLTDSRQNAGWKQVGRGIFIRPRNDPGNGYSAEQYGRRYMNDPRFRAQSDWAAADQRSVGRWNAGKNYYGALSGTGWNARDQREIEGILANTHNDTVRGKAMAGIKSPLTEYKAKSYFS